jgi:hypothetical protein
MGNVWQVEVIRLAEWTEEERMKTQLKLEFVWWIFEENAVGYIAQKNIPTVNKDAKYNMPRTDKESFNEG